MKKLLIVVDMQRDFVDGALGTAEAVAIVDKIVSKIENFDGDIIVTYDTHFENYMQTQEGKLLPVEHCIKGKNGWELDAKVQAAVEKRGYYAIEKPTFGSVALAEYIRANYEADLEIELVGLCTDICVVSNALLLKANFPEITMRVDASCCAGVTVASHNAALATMKMCQIHVIGEEIKEKEAAMERKIEAILYEIHLPKHLKGYLYLAEALRICAEDQTLLQDNALLYSQIAEHLETTPARVERAIRHAFEVACVDPNTNAEFLASLVEKL